MVLQATCSGAEPELSDGDAFHSAEAEPPRLSEDLDSTCSTPFVSAPSSPGRPAYFFSAPASPMHYLTSSLAHAPAFASDSSVSAALEFEFSSRSSPNGAKSADELFFNGQIRPIKLASHLQRPQILTPLIDLETEEDEDEGVGQGMQRRGRERDLKLRSGSIHRKARSLSPIRNAPYPWLHDEEEAHECNKCKRDNTEEISNLGDYAESKRGGSESSTQTAPSASASSSRSSSSGRNSKKWVFLKDLLYRSKSEGRGRENGKEKEKFWSSISFHHFEKKINLSSSSSGEESQKKKKGSKQQTVGKNGKPANGVAAKRGVRKSPHELHYTANRAQAEEMKKRTFLPYRQGLLGCLSFSSKGYGALNGLTRTLDPVSSR